MISDLKNEREDFAYLKRMLLTESGVVPDQINEQDYFEFLEIMKAKPRDKRVLNVAEARQRMRQN